MDLQRDKNIANKKIHSIQFILTNTYNIRLPIIIDSGNNNRTDRP